MKQYRQAEEVRAAAVLTTSYVNSSAIGDETQEYNSASIYADFTIGSLTTAELLVEFSPDGTNYYQEVDEATPSAGVSAIDPLVRQLDATGAYRFLVPMKDRYIRVRAKGTGTATGSSLALLIALGNR